MVNVNEITAGIGGAITIGGVMAMFRFLNVKIDKKQDKALCANIAENFNKGLARGEEKFDKIMDVLGKIKTDNAAIKQQLKYINGNAKHID